MQAIQYFIDFFICLIHCDWKLLEIFGQLWLFQFSCGFINLDTFSDKELNLILAFFLTPLVNYHLRLIEASFSDICILISTILKDLLKYALPFFFWLLFLGFFEGSYFNLNKKLVFIAQ